MLPSHPEDLREPTSIDEMCEIIKSFGIVPTEYTDCTILYTVTFDQLRAIYNAGCDRCSVISLRQRRQNDSTRKG